MYEKNLTEDLRLRLSANDMNLLRELSTERACSISEVIRSIIGDYRRGLEVMKLMQNATNLMKENGGLLFNGDTKTDLNHIV